MSVPRVPTIPNLSAPPVAADLTAIVPAYNEEATIEATVRSLLAQTVPPRSILVVDDCSTDATAERARRLGATVVSPPSNTGSKAGAQSFALREVSTGYVMAVDADTTLDTDAVETILPALRDPAIAAACGLVVPRRVRTVWERGRYIEYLLAFSFFKRVQDHFGAPLISSGCFSVYRTETLAEVGGWSARTLAEDVDLTWTLYQAGHGVRFVPAAVSRPLEPHSFAFVRAQLTRWSHGLMQNVRLHWRRILHLRFLRSVVAVLFWDAVVAPVVFLLVLPVLAVLVTPWALLGYAIDGPALMVPVLVEAVSRRELGRALVSMPAFFVLRMANAWFMLAAVWGELLLRRPLTVYEKGH